MTIMKPLIFFFSLTLSIPAFAQQDSIAPDFASTSMTPSFGLVFTDATIRTGADSSYRSSPQMGFSLGFDLLIPSYNDSLDYQTGLYYSLSRTEFTETFDQQNYTEGTITLQSLSLPLLGRFYPFTKSWGLYLQAGAVGNYFIDGTIESRGISSGTISPLESIKLSEQQNFQRWTADAVAGIGFATSIYRSFGFFIELSYRHGLTPITYGDEEIRTNTLFTQFGVAL